MNAIECEHLTRTFGRTWAVKDLNLTVPQGSIFALLGANGAGKSTTLKLMLNLLRPSSGTVRVLGVESTKIKKEMFQRIGYVTEDQALHEWMTLDQLLNYYRPCYPQWDLALEKQLRARFGLPRDRALKKMSRGMKMKAALLSVLPFRPELLVLDEPFSGLDPQVRDEFIQGLLEIVDDDRSNTIVVSSHDIAEVERVADWVGIMSEGQLVTAEPVAALQGRFRRIEIVGLGVAALVQRQSVPTWRQIARPAENVVQFVHTIDTWFEFEKYRATIVGQFDSKPGVTGYFPRGVCRLVFLLLSPNGEVRTEFRFVSDRVANGDIFGPECILYNQARHELSRGSLPSGLNSASFSHDGIQGRTERRIFSRIWNILDHREVPTPVDSRWLEGTQFRIVEWKPIAAHIQEYHWDPIRLPDDQSKH